MFKRRATRPLLDIVPPSGLFVKAPDGQVWYVKNGKRYKVSDIHFDSWNVTPARITATALLLVPQAGKIGFRDGTLCQDFGSGKIYLISDSTRRQVRNPATYEALGGDAVCHSVPSSYLDIHREGEALD